MVLGEVVHGRQVVASDLTEHASQTNVEHLNVEHLAVAPVVVAAEVKVGQDLKGQEGDLDARLKIVAMENPSVTVNQRIPAVICPSPAKSRLRDQNAVNITRFTPLFPFFRS